jgi:phage regulator Rha-like protein
LVAGYQTSQIHQTNQGHYKPWGKKIKMFNISQAAIEQVVNDMRSGKSDEFVKEFFASRPEWVEDDKATTQTDNKQEEKQATAARA